jgi:Plasmid pRiA4b ORF-3-like protein
MRKPSIAQTEYVAHASIVLDKVVPEVSRVVAVPLGIRVHDLHAIIQAAVGWTDTHLWLFRAKGMYWGVPDPDYPDDTIPASRTWLLDMVADIGTYRFKYVYDFGDRWMHTVKITKPMPTVAGVDYPLLLHAVGRCPREDCGGPEEYVALLAALRNRSEPRHAEAVELLGSDFDPTKVHLRHEQEVAALASRIASRRRRTVKAKPPAKPREPDDYF